MCQVAYNVGMRFLRLLGSFLVILLFHTAITAVVVAILFMQLLAGPTLVKDALDESGVYQVFVDDISQQIEEQAAEALNSDRSTVRGLVQESLDASLVQEQFEVVIDAVYDWLGGDTDKPRFTIDFSDARTGFIEGVASELETELSALPDCTSFEQVQPNADPQVLTCIPPGFTAEELAASYEQELLESADFLSEVRLSSEELLADLDHGFADSNAPTVFQLLNGLLWPSVAALAISSFGIVVLARSKQQGLRRLGGQYIMAGFGLVLSAAIVWLALDNLLVIEQGNQLQAALFEAFRLLLNDMLAIIAVGGVVAFAGGFLLRKLVNKPKKK